MFEIFYIGSIFTAFVTIYLLLFKSDAIRSYADYLISLYLVCAVWTIVLYLLVSQGYIVIYPHLYKTAAPLNFIITPLAYLYVRAMLYNDKFFSLKDWWHFLPFVLVVLNYMPFFLLPINQKGVIVSDLVNNKDLAYQVQTGFVSEGIIYFFRLFQTIIYLFFQWQLVIKFKKSYKVVQVQKQVNDVLKWVRIFNWATTAFLIALFSFLILILIFKSIFIFTSILTYLPSVLYSASFFILSTYLLTHPSILAGLPFVKYRDVEPNILDEVVNKVAFIQEDYSTQIEQINSYLQNTKPYFKNNLSIGHVSIALNIPIRELSYIINNYYNQRFSDLINSYRLKYIIEKINESYLENFTIESVAMEAGFNSKSAFYKSFNKFYQTTPSEYFNKTN